MLSARTFFEMRSLYGKYIISAVHARQVRRPQMYFSLKKIKLLLSQFIADIHNCVILGSHSQKSATFTVTSITDVLTMQHHIKACNKYLNNWLGD